MSQVSGYSATTSQMYQSTLEGSGIHRETFQDRMTQTRNWIWNPEEQTIMGRTILDWGLVFLFNFVFIASLLAMSSVFCGLFFWYIDWNFPMMQGANSILQIPGMSFRPQPDVDTRLIRFVKGDTTSYQHYLDHTEAYIQYYENELQVGENYIDCSAANYAARRPDKDLDKVCEFNPIVLGGDCVKQQNYGYDDGQPCVLLKLNKVFDWVPEEYTAENVHPDIADVWNPDDPWHVYVKCDGDDAATRENMGEIIIYPSQGFPFKYFPFRNQQGYRSPLAFLRFESPLPGILLMMTCKAYAKNIIHDHVAEYGQISFEVMVD